MEVASDGRPPLAVVYPPHVVDAVDFTGVKIDLAPALPDFAPRRFDAIRWGYLRARGEPTKGRLDASPDLDSSPGVGGRELSFTEGDWVGMQTHWAWTERGLFIARRFAIATETHDRLAALLADAVPLLSERFRQLTHRWCVAELPRQRPLARDGNRRTTSSFPPTAWFPFPYERLGEGLEAPGQGPVVCASTHRIAFGASGSGKSTWLADDAVARFREGMAVVTIDLHGDLREGIEARLSREELARLHILDTTDPETSGIDVMAPVPGAPNGAATRYLLAGLKRLTPDGSTLYWGFRLERILENFAALVEERGGDLHEMVRLLTEPAFRDAARLATRRPELARFLDELEPLLRKNPEFLWSATSRLAPFLLHPALRRILAPGPRGLDVDRELGSGGILLLRIPISAHGPEIASFAGTLLLARVYYGIVARGAGAKAPGVLLLLDEAPLFAPSLVAEILAEGRKFGVRAVVVTQYPERLAPELRDAAAGAASCHLAFRTPSAAAASVGRWVGLDRDDAQRWLPSLDIGEALVSDATRGATPRVWKVPPPPAPRRPAPSPLRTAPPEPIPMTPEKSEERLLLALLQSEESRRPLGAEELVRRASESPGETIPLAHCADALHAAIRRGWISEGEEGRLCLTEAGGRFIGLRAPTHAARESDEHRRLVIAAFRLFARKGYRIEIVRQGRFDTTLPDARLHQLPELSGASLPHALAEAIDRARRGWAWRFFGGRNVHIEAEVSGAMRAERIRHGIRKARAHNAFILFLVGDAARARRVRSVLRAEGCSVQEGQVWTLPLTSFAPLPVGVRCRDPEGEDPTGEAPNASPHHDIAGRRSASRCLSPGAEREIRSHSRRERSKSVALRPPKFPGTTCSTGCWGARCGRSSLFQSLPMQDLPGPRGT